MRSARSLPDLGNQSEIRQARTDFVDFAGECCSITQKATKYGRPDGFAADLP
jgi:hypothetical protein